MANKWIGMGRITRDPNCRYYTDKNNNQQTAASFTVACDRQGKDNGADFIKCNAFGALGSFVEKYLRQGTKIYIEGKITTGDYTNKEGVKVYTTEVTADHIEFAESKSAGSGQGNQKKEETGFMNVPDGIDEELPFA